MSDLAIAEERSEFGELVHNSLDTLPSSRRLRSEQLEVLYALAYAHVTQGKYAEALPIFSLLATYGPTRKHYLLGLALCLQMNKRFDEAVGIYSLAAVLFPGTPEVPLLVAECLLMQGDREEARQELARVARLIEAAAGKYDSWKPRAQALMGLAERKGA